MLSVSFRHIIMSPKTIMSPRLLKAWPRNIFQHKTPKSPKGPRHRIGHLIHVKNSFAKRVFAVLVLNMKFMFNMFLV